MNCAVCRWALPPQRACASRHPRQHQRATFRVSCAHQGIHISCTVKPFRLLMISHILVSFRRPFLPLHTLAYTPIPPLSIHTHCGNPIHPLPITVTESGTIPCACIRLRAPSPAHCARCLPPSVSRAPSLPPSLPPSAPSPARTVPCACICLRVPSPARSLPPSLNDSRRIRFEKPSCKKPSKCRFPDISDRVSEHAHAMTDADPTHFPSCCSRAFNRSEKV
jgi:hypothetical protein